MSIARFQRIDSTGKHITIPRERPRTPVGSSMDAGSRSQDSSMHGSSTFHLVKPRIRTRRSDWLLRLSTRQWKWPEWSPIGHHLHSKTVLAASLEQRVTTGEKSTADKMSIPTSSPEATAPLFRDVSVTSSGSQVQVLAWIQP